MCVLGHKIRKYEINIGFNKIGTTILSVESVRWPENINCCFLCMWDSKATDKQYLIKNWPKWKESICGKLSVKYLPLIDVILFPLGLKNHFMKAMEQNSDGFLYLR